MNKTIEEQKDILRKALEDRRRYEEWVSEIDRQGKPEMWMPFPDFLAAETIRQDEEGRKELLAR